MEPRRTDGRIASRKEATLLNLTQRLPWGGRRGKNLRNRMHDLREKTHAFFTSRCVYSCEGAFTFSSFSFPRIQFTPRKDQRNANGVPSLYLQRYFLPSRKSHRSSLILLVLFSISSKMTSGVSPSASGANISSGTASCPASSNPN